MRTVLERVVRIFGSFRLACSLFVLLLVVVLIGTLEQQHMSLYEVQKTYFASLFFVYPIGGKVPVPFPGGALLLALLAVNVIIGGMLRLPRSWRSSGVWTVHLGILLLLGGSFVEFKLSQKGFLRLEEGETGERFSSYEEWEVALVRRGAEPKEWVVSARDLESSAGGGRLRVVAPDLPFELVLSGYARHTAVREARSANSGIDGVEVVAISSETLDGGGNAPGVVASIVEKGGVVVGRGFLRGAEEAYPWTTTVGEATYDVALRRRSFAMPFVTRLDRALEERHPGTGMPRRFSSYVAVTEGGVSRDVHITMNEPLRLRGMILYQSEFGRDPESGRTFSTFAVVHNPSDQVPLIACVVIGIGMGVHFILRLVKHIDAEGKRRARRRAEDVDDDGAQPAGSAS